MRTNTFSKAFCFTLLLAAGAFFSCEEKNHDAQIEALIQEIKEEFAPDKRVAIWDISLEGNEITGETDQEMALQKFRSKLEEKGFSNVESITLLPAESLEEKTQAVVTISVANIRSAAKHSAELATQALMGTPVKVLKQDGGWYLIQTPDKYISWVDAAGIALMDRQSFSQWQASEKVVFLPLNGFVFEDESKTSWLSDLVAGNILEVVEKRGLWYEVKLPDGRKGLVSATEVQDFEAWKNSRSLTSENLISTAKSMMGSPYLWGGTSIKGIDCSGFTKTIFYLNGQVIPRDASQQIHEGDLVDDSKDWSKLEVGDLLFFGEKGTADKKERIVHVGMWIGDNSFIHSRGLVRISSFDEDSPNYDEYELNRYLRTKRVIGKENPNITSVENSLTFE